MIASIEAIVDNAIRIDIKGLSIREREALARALSIPNPAHAVARRRGRVPYGVPPTLLSMRTEGQTFVIPRGATRLVRDAIPGVRFVDRRFSAEPVAFTFRGELRAHQIAAVDAIVQHEQGFAVVSTGGGKTAIALGSIARIRQPALVVVGSLDLLEQWQQQARRFLGFEPGTIGGGAVDVRDVTIATWQTLSERPDLLASCASRFGSLFIDEAHHAAAGALSRVIGAFPAKYRIGLTGTAMRADGLEALLEHHLGRIIFRTTYSELAASGHLLVPRYETLRTSFTFPYENADDWPELLDALVRDEHRNRAIVDAVSHACASRRVALVLTGRVAHAEKLAEMLNATGTSTKALVGSMSRRARTEALDRARAGEIDALVATSLADEGLDVPRLDHVVLGFPARAEGRLLQRIGRVLRLHESKGEPVVIDVVDDRVGVLAHQARLRREAFDRTWPTLSEVA